MSLSDSKAPVTGPSPPFTSYSLNYEDLILKRLFPKQKRGFYVDVGAGHPQYENDLFAFYNRGWSGINVEPNEQFFELHQQIRPRDQNLCMLLSDAPGEPLTYYQIDGSGLSTCDETQAKAHATHGHALQARNVPVGTLAGILAEAGVRFFDILKVDVEGFEEKVLSGNDWERFRPSVVLVEVTYPESRERRPSNIRGFMEQRGYRHVLFDGLNDFYLEHSFQEPPGLTLPPNVFDHFVSREIADLREQVESLQTNFAAAERYALSLQANQDEVRRSAAEIQEEAKRSAAEIQEEAKRSVAEIQEEAKRSVAEIQAERNEALSATEALATENRKLQQQLRSRSNETRRLSAAADQMRTEITVLSRMLEPLHTALEHSRQMSRDHNQMNRDQADRIERLHAELKALHTRLHDVHASRSWLLTKPWRVAGRLLKRLSG